MAWSRSNLGEHLVGDTIILPAGSSVDIATFEALFADAIAAGGSYADFAAVDYQGDAEGRPVVNRGYRAFFDQLRAEGLLV